MSQQAVKSETPVSEGEAARAPVAGLVAEVRANSSAMTPALASQIRACAACFGMTPADRSRLSVPPAPRGDDTAEFFDDPAGPRRR